MNLYVLTIKNENDDNVKTSVSILKQGIIDSAWNTYSGMYEKNKHRIKDDKYMQSVFKEELRVGKIPVLTLPHSSVYFQLHTHKMDISFGQEGRE